MKKTITVQGIEINIVNVKEEDYFSLTDMAGTNDDRPDLIIQNWMRNKSTVMFLAEWEMIHNKDFNSFGCEGIKNKEGNKNLKRLPNPNKGIT